MKMDAIMIDQSELFYFLIRLPRLLLEIKGIIFVLITF